MPKEEPTTREGVSLASLARASNGFDTIRLIAATAVIFSHAFPLTGQVEPLHALTGQATFGMLAVSVFFAISGYLIPMSFDRGGIGRYVMKRARRIMPALIVAVLLCAFLLGPIYTTLPLAEYLRAPGTWKFVGNAFFLPVGYDLPGVFTANPMDDVNGSLWSLKFEIACYVFVVAALIFSPLRKLAVVGAWLASFVIVRLIPGDGQGVWFFVDQLAALFRFFGMGMVFYLFSDRIVVKKSWGWIALGIFVASAFTPVFVEVCAVAGIYALFVFAYNAHGRFREITAKGDISYGVYVYAFPVQQMLVPASLGLAGAGLALAPWINTGLALIPVFALGVWSWLYVEKPAMFYKHKTITRPSLKA